MAERVLTGRQVLTCPETEITSENLVKVLRRARRGHSVNSADINYLYNYRRGYQPILDRTKDVRPEICNKIVENRADEISTFKVGYLMGEPIQYVSRGGDDVSEDIQRLNDFMFSESKEASDLELADWFTVCGTAYRLELPNPKYGIDEEAESPFNLYVLDPRYTFVVYSNRIERKPMLGCSYVMLEDGSELSCVYTDTTYYEVKNGKIVTEIPHGLGDIPIIEYPANTARLGAFEIVLPMLDAMNRVASNRLDGIEQFIQALMMFKGVDIEADDFKSLKDLGAIKVPPDGDIKYLVQELNQMETQTLVDYMYQTVLTICGMPNRNGGTSTSDTGSAVIMRDGWSDAEARAKRSEMMFKLSEKRMLRLALRICRDMCGMQLKASDIEIRFTRRNYENIQMKAQVLTTMLGCEKIHPRLAFSACGMFPDPELAYTESMAYAKEREDELIKSLEETDIPDGENDV